MTHSEGDNNRGENVAEAKEDKTKENETQETVITESGEIDTGANSNEIFSDSAPGENNSAAKNETDGDGKDHE